MRCRALRTFAPSLALFRPALVWWCVRRESRVVLLLLQPRVLSGGASRHGESAASSRRRRGLLSPVAERERVAAAALSLSLTMPPDPLLLIRKAKAERVRLPRCRPCLNAGGLYLSSTSIRHVPSIAWRRLPQIRRRIQGAWYTILGSLSASYVSISASRLSGEESSSSSRHAASPLWPHHACRSLHGRLFACDCSATATSLSLPTTSLMRRRGRQPVLIATAL